MQTIITKTLNATGTRVRRRVKATCQGGSTTLHWHHAFDENENHRAAAEALAAKLGWDCLLVSGSDGVKGYHNPLGDVTAKRDRQGITNYKAGQTAGVAWATDSEYGAAMQIDSRRGDKTKWLNIDRRMINAITALFNDQNL